MHVSLASPLSCVAVSEYTSISDTTDRHTHSHLSCANACLSLKCTSLFLPLALVSLSLCWHHQVTSLVPQYIRWCMYTRVCVCVCVVHLWVHIMSPHHDLLILKPRHWCHNILDGTYILGCVCVSYIPGYTSSTHWESTSWFVDPQVTSLVPSCVPMLCTWIVPQSKYTSWVHMMTCTWCVPRDVRHTHTP